MGSRRRVIFVTPNTVGTGMAGVGMRHFEMAQALSGEFDVSLVVPEIGGETLPQVPIQAIGREGNLPRIVQGADVLIIQGDLFRRYPGFVPPEVPIVIDMACPVLLEDLENRKGRRGGEGEDAILRESLEHEDLLGMVNHLLRTGDFFLCGGERQRDLILGMLLAVGRLNPRTYRGDSRFEGLASVVPYGVSDEAPKRNGPGPRASIPKIHRDDLLLYWGGGLWNWLDPETVVEAMVEIGKLRSDVKLIFPGIRHPDPNFYVPEVTRRTVEAAERAGLAGTTIFFNDWVPYRERGSFLLDCDIGVSAHRESVETRFAVRTRLMDYLWAGLPILTTDGDEAADLVRNERLGEVVPPGDMDAWVRGILRLTGDRRGRKACGRRSRKVGERFRWSVGVEPLARFCRNPSRSADHRLSPNGREKLGGAFLRYGGKVLSLASDGRFQEIFRGVRRMALRRLRR